MAQQTDPRILGTEPIGKLLLQYSIPAIIGMTCLSIGTFLIINKEDYVIVTTR